MSAIDNNRLQSGWLNKCVEQFRCIGPECEESCCGNWQITMDEPALVALSGLKDAHVSAVLATHLRRLDDARTSTQIGWLQLRPDGRCPFLDQDSLCAIQARHGEAPMPLGCKVYPRVHHRIDGELHSALSLSCPEATRRLLSASDESFQPGFESLLTETLASLPAAATWAETFWSWLSVHTAILRRRRWPMADRMFHMGYLAQSLDARHDGNAAAALRECCQVLLDQANKPVVESRAIAAEPLEFLLSAMNSALGFAGENQRFRELTSCVLRGLAYWPGVDPLPRCQQLRDEALEPLLADHPQWMENYLCNELVRRLYPLGASKLDQHPLDQDSRSLAVDEFARLSLEWAWIRLYWIGMSGDCSLDLETATLCVQSLSRAVFARRSHFDALCRAWRRLMSILPLENLLSL